MSTRGIQFLKQKRIAHQVVRYEHAEKGAKFAAQTIGFPLEQTIKTLVAVLDGDRYILVLLPGDRQLSLKKLAAACKAKRAAMSDAALAERLTGYQVGGISPFGAKKSLPVIMESALLSYACVMINAGRRGVMVQLAPMDIVRLLNARSNDLIA
jgi:Cys-tRNA(Pro)/Cys-tRNA(Cys) deacylase